MNAAIFATVLVLGEICIIIGGLFAYGDRFFSVSQMKSKGINQGLPFVANGNVWADFFIISPLIAELAGRYSSYWSVNGLVISISAGIIASIVLHRVYAKTDIPESAFNNRRLTKSGWAHFFYMAGALSVFFLFYFFTPAFSFTVFTIVSTVLVFHILVANHIFLEIWKPLWWNNSKFKTKELIFSVSVLVILLALRGYFLYA